MNDLKWPSVFEKLGFGALLLIATIVLWNSLESANNRRGEELTERITILEQRLSDCHSNYSRLLDCQHK